MSISTHFQQVSSKREGRRTKTRVGRSLTCCDDENIEVLGLQRGVGGDQRRRRLAHVAQRATAVPIRAGTCTPSRTVWRRRVAERAVRRGGCIKLRSNFRVPAMTLTT